MQLAPTARAAAADSACAEGAHGAGIVAVAGDRFSALAGRPEESLRASAWHGGKRVAVPFQIDECDADGRVVVGTAAAPPPAPQLGPNTVVLLRRRDAGDEASGRAESPAFGVEIDASTDERKSHRWIYFGAADGKLLRSSEDDVDYDPEHDRIHASRYTLGFERPQVGYFAVADGKGHDRPNLIDRLKARVTAHALWGLMSFRRNEEQVSETVVGYRDGPLRVTRRAHLEVEIGWGLPAPQFVAEDYFYDDHAEGPVSISLPFALSYVFGDLDVRIFLDFRNLEGYELAAEGMGARTVRVGEERAIDSLAPVRSTWFVLRRGGEGLLHRLRLGPGLESVQSALYYVYDPELPDPPEAVRGERPAVGYRLTGWSGVSRGSYELWMDTYLLDGAAASDPRSTIAALDAAPVITVREIGR